MDTPPGRPRADTLAPTTGADADQSQDTGKPAQKTKENRHFVTALARGLEILACFGNGETTLSNIELAKRCTLPKSTVSRLTMTLTQLGYLIHVQETGRYRLGTACLGLGSSLLSRLDVRKIAHPFMLELSRTTGTTVSLGVRDRLSMIYAESCYGPQVAFAYKLDVGSRIPLATTAMGRAWLAMAPLAERNQVLAQLKESDPDAWPSIEQGCTRALNDFRHLGVTCSFGDWRRHVNGIARAFDPGNGLPLMVLNIGGPAHDVSPEFLLATARPRLIETVRSIEHALPRRLDTY